MSHWNIISRKHRHTPSPFMRELHELAQRVDRDTAATVTVVLRRCSGSYRDVNLLVGAVVAWLGLIFLLVSPWEVAEWSLPIDTAVLFALSAWICSRTPLRRWLTSRKRRRHQVHVAARAACVEEGVWQAPRNQGVLIFWSRLERQLDVLVAEGVHEKVPLHEWNKLVHALRQVPRQPHPPKMFLERLKELGAMLAAHLPPLPHEDTALRMEDAR